MWETINYSNCRYSIVSRNDELKKLKWPEFFAQEPKVGDFIVSACMTIAVIKGIYHRFSLNQDNKQFPYVEIQIELA